MLTPKATFDRAEAVLQAINQREPQRLAELCHPRFEGFDVTRERQQTGPSGLARDVDGLIAAFPDVYLDAFDASKQTSSVGLFWVQRGTHTGTFLGVPPTGRAVSFCGYSHLQFHEDGRLYRALHLWDMAGLLRRIRILPDLPGSARIGDQFALMMRVLSGHSPTTITQTSS